MKTFMIIVIAMYGFCMACGEIKDTVVHTQAVAGSQYVTPGG